MSRNILVRALLSLAATAVGCSPSAPPAPAVVEPAMVFPMIVVWPGQQLVVWRDQAAFKTMHTNILHNTSLGDPVLIDGSGGLFDVRGMQSTKSGAWAMINPVAMSPIEFTLSKRDPTGIAAARELVAGCKYLGRSSDTDAARKQILAASDVAAIVAALDADSSPTSSPADSLPQP
jgi:hypothetical protein